MTLSENLQPDETTWLHAASNNERPAKPMMKRPRFGRTVAGPFRDRNPPGREKRPEQLAN
jgi:hypothetical protein